MTNTRIARVEIPPMDRMPRHFRIDFTPGTTGLETNAREVMLERAPITNAVGIRVQRRATRYPPVGRCIYCGATELRPGSGLPLSEEHIVADGLGGTLILPEASCEACAKATCRIEGKVLRTHLFAPRARLGIKGTKRKYDEGANYPATTVVKGKDVVVMLPIDTHPTVLFMVGFRPPRFLLDGRKRSADISGWWHHTFGTPSEALQKSGGESLASPAFDTVTFSQMIAKIAHAFAAAEIGLSNFSPLLPPFILRRFANAEQYPACFEYVGGANDLYAPDENDLHTLGYQIGRFKDRDYLVVYVRLFANLGAPVYTAIVGEMTGKRA